MLINTIVSPTQHGQINGFTLNDMSPTQSQAHSPCHSWALQAARNVQINTTQTNKKTQIVFPLRASKTRKLKPSPKTKSGYSHGFEGIMPKHPVANKKQKYQSYKPTPRK